MPQCSSSTKAVNLLKTEETTRRRRIRLLMQDLAERAVSTGQCLSDRRSHARTNGTLHTDPLWRPGGYIERLRSDQRELLKTLTSEDLQGLSFRKDAITEVWHRREGPPNLRTEGPFANGEALKLPPTVWRLK